MDTESCDEKEDKTINFSEDIYLFTVMNTVLDGLITIKKDGTIQSFNHAASRIFGYSHDEVIGKNVKMLMPAPYHDEHDSYLTNYIETRDPKVIGKGREVSGRRKTGAIFPMELGVNEMWFNGELMFVGTIRDISERKEAEKNAQAYIEALKLSNQELDDFAYIASHDLKEPLRGISNNAIFLKEDYQENLPPEAIKRLDRMRYLCERLERLTDDLLYFSRISKQELAITEVDLNSVIEDIANTMECLLSEKNAKISIPNSLPKVVCDGVRITEVFRNLITNAIKYNEKPEKHIEIGCSKTSNDVKINGRNNYIFYVKDNGIGIKNDYFESIFRIFKRLNDEADPVKGTGVGLTFVKKIIERHGGRIWVESELGKGTTFYFTIRSAING